MCVCVCGGGGGGFYLHIWQHRASSNHDLFCFAYDYVGDYRKIGKGIPSIKQLKFIVSQPR